MRKTISSILFLFAFTVFVNAQTESAPDFTWGNTAFFNLKIGESIHYLQTDIKLLSVANQCNKIKVGDDTISVNVSQRTPAIGIYGLNIYVADNRNFKAISNKPSLHGLLTKDALIAVSNFSNLLINNRDYVFPVTFNEGFVWNLEADNYPFSVIQADYYSNEFTEMSGVYFDLQDNKGKVKHWMVAIENSTVVWIKENRNNSDGKCVDILLESESQPGIYYYYGSLYKRNVEVREKQKLREGELIGTVLGEKSWGPAHFSVLKNDTTPGINDVETNIINFFPQLFELYFNQKNEFSRILTKGDIKFGLTNETNVKNNLEFVRYLGTGWKLGCWNILGKVPFIEKNRKGNIRLNNILYEGSAFEAVNPEGYYDFEINVHNGLYRISAQLGDVELDTWQKVAFEGRSMGEFSLDKGTMHWTDERAVTVEDGKLTVRIYVDPDGIPAGLSEIVFQQVR